MPKCPHDRIEFCPLYVAAHDAGCFGCDDGKLDQLEGCAIDRGADYGQMIARLCVTRREIVQDCAERESWYLRVEQRKRNLRLNGVH